MLPEFLVYPNLVRLIVGSVLFWIGVYLVSRNIKSTLAWIIFLFLFSLSWYIIFVDVLMPLYNQDRTASYILERVTTWTYIIPIPIILHLSMLTTGRRHLPVNRASLYMLYVVAVILAVLGAFTNLVVNSEQVLFYSEDYGFFAERGPLFPVIAVISVWSASLAVWNYQMSLRSSYGRGRVKFWLATIGSFLYAIIGPFLVWAYYQNNLYDFSVYATAPLLIGPVIFWLISILFFRLVSDVEEIFNLKEFVYLSAAILALTLLYGGIYLQFASSIGVYAALFTVVFMYLTIFTHAFYDWLTTFIRDLLYNAGKGFSLITDADVADLVRNFHTHEKLEVGPLLRFRAVKRRATEGRLVDAARDLVKEAIQYFKQEDYPRRTKLNLKYQILKMLVLDESEEGQILWELGFDGYPMKILTGEDATRKPLFKVESMSDYTATSRNAFIALKKEAIHDLAWRLSYLERTDS